MEVLSLLLTAKEAIATLLEAVSLFNKRSRTKVDEGDFKILAEEAFKRAVAHLTGLGLLLKDFGPASKLEYLNKASYHFQAKDGFYSYSKGEIEKFFLDAFQLPKKNRFDVFAKYLFFLRNGLEKLFRISLVGEQVFWLLRRKNTVFHYMAIDGWTGLKYKELVSRVSEVKHARLPRLYDKINYGSSSFNSNDAAIISKAIDVVLESGKISERAILNLASTEKILIVHKYGEGFGEVYKPQQLKFDAISEEIKSLGASNDPDKDEKIRKKKKEKKILIENWVRAPIGSALEEIGFQKLFNKMDGVYVYPVFMLPEKYREKPTSYVTQAVIPRARKLLNNMRKKRALPKDHDGGLKFVVLAHVVSLEEVIFLTQERDLGISSPMMYRLLFRGFLVSNRSTMGSIYVNDIVRNVDVLSFWGEDSKSAKYLRSHFELLKKYLWEKHQIEIYKPVNLITLSSQDIQALSEFLHTKDKSLAVHHIRSFFTKTVNFYQQLNSELANITSRSQVNHAK